MINATQYCVADKSPSGDKRLADKVYREQSELLSWATRIFIILSLLFMWDREKRMNKRFIDFIIGGCYLSDRAQSLHDKVKKYLLKMYAHLMIEWRKLVERWEEDE